MSLRAGWVTDVARPAAAAHDDGGVKLDINAATSFLATHGRVLDQRRLRLQLGEGDGDVVLAALEAYRNPDGGYGWGLEPDLRSNRSQPAAAIHALEVLAEVAPETTPRAVELCDWLRQHTLADGGLPFALPVPDPSGCAPFWIQADPGTSSMQVTAQVVANAHLLGRHQPEVEAHPWLATATEYCLDAVRRITDGAHAYELMSALQFLDAVADRVPVAEELLERLGRSLPVSGSLHVEGGADDETLHPLSLAPYPGRPVRHLFREDVIAGDLERLAAQQQTDGGWPVDFASYSPAAALEWRGHTTVRAVQILRANVS